MNYLSHLYQNSVAQVVYKRFFREQGSDRYSAAKMEEIGAQKAYAQITLNDFASTKTGAEKREGILAHFSEQHLFKNSACYEAKKLLAHCVEQELKKLTRQFEEDKTRDTNQIPLKAHLIEVSKLMSRAREIVADIERYYGQTHHLTTNDLDERFKDVIKFCDDKLRGLPHVAELRIYEVLIPVEVFGEAERENLPKMPAIPSSQHRSVGPGLFAVMSPPGHLSAEEDAELKALRAHEKQEEAERQDIAKALIGKEEKGNVSFYRSQLRDVLAKATSNHEYRVGKIAIPRENILAEIKPVIDRDDPANPKLDPPYIQTRHHLNDLYVSSKKQMVVYILDGHDPSEVLKKGISESTMRLYISRERAYYDRLKYDHSRVDSKGNGLEGGKSFVFDYSVEDGWKKTAVKPTETKQEERSRSPGKKGPL